MASPADMLATPPSYSDKMSQQQKRLLSTFQEQKAGLVKKTTFKQMQKMTKGNCPKITIVNPGLQQC